MRKDHDRQVRTPAGNVPVVLTTLCTNPGVSDKAGTADKPNHRLGCDHRQCVQGSEEPDQEAGFRGVSDEAGNLAVHQHEGTEWKSCPIRAVRRPQQCIEHITQPLD